MAAAALQTSQQLIQGLSIEVVNFWRRSYGDAWARSEDWTKALVRRVQTKNNNTHLTIEAEQRRIRVVPIGTRVDSMQTLGREYQVKLNKVNVDGVSCSVTEVQDPMIGRLVMDDVASMLKYLTRASKERVIESLINGDTDPIWTGYDGDQIFSTTHSVGAGGVAWNNLEPGDAISTDDLTADNFFAILSKLMAVPSGPEGQPFPLDNPTFHLIVPPGPLWKAALEIANNVWSPKANTFTENVLATQMQGQIKVVMEPLLYADPLTWYVVVTTPDVQPWINLYLTEGGSGQLIPLIDPKDRNVLDHDRYEWHAKLYEETAPVRFEMMVKVVGS